MSSSSDKTEFVSAPFAQPRSRTLIASADGEPPQAKQEDFGQTAFIDPELLKALREQARQSQGGTQAPGGPDVTQGQAPGQFAAPGQFPAQGQAPGQFAPPSQFPAHAQAPGQFPAHAQAPGQFPAQSPASQFPAQAPGPYASQAQPGNPYASQGQPGNPYASQAQPGNPYASQAQPSQIPTTVGPSYSEYAGAASQAPYAASAPYAPPTGTSPSVPDVSSYGGAAAPQGQGHGHDYSRPPQAMGAPVGADHPFSAPAAGPPPGSASLPYRPPASSYGSGGAYEPTSSLQYHHDDNPNASHDALAAGEDDEGLHWGIIILGGVGALLLGVGLASAIIYFRFRPFDEPEVATVVVAEPAKAEPAPKPRSKLPTLDLPDIPEVPEPPPAPVAPPPEPEPAPLPAPVAAPPEPEQLPVIPPPEPAVLPPEPEPEPEPAPKPTAPAPRVTVFVKRAKGADIDLRIDNGREQRITGDQSIKVKPGTRKVAVRKSGTVVWYSGSASFDLGKSYELVLDEKDFDVRSR